MCCDFAVSLMVFRDANVLQHPFLAQTVLSMCYKRIIHCDAMWIDMIHVLSGGAFIRPCRGVHEIFVTFFSKIFFWAGERHLFIENIFFYSSPFWPEIFQRWLQICFFFMIYCDFWQQNINKNHFQFTVIEKKAACGAVFKIRNRDN